MPLKDTIYVGMLDVLRASNVVTAAIFGVKVWRKILKLNWDLTTIVLKKAIDKYCIDAKKDILDMGCGHIAILSQYIKKRYATNTVSGVDIYQQLVDTASRNVKENGLDISILCSDLYSNVKGTYDCIVFNPPYIPVDSKEMAYPKTGYSGPDGTETMRRFLKESRPYLKEEGRILLGINCYYVPYKKAVGIIEEYGYRIEDVISRRFNTSRAFVIH